MEPISMMLDDNNINYNLWMEQELEKIRQTNFKPTLLLHSCCAPCSSYVLKLLQKYFHITVFFYNANLYPSNEYLRRLKDQKRLIRILNKEATKKIENNDFEDPVFYETPIKISNYKYNQQEFYDFIKGFENSPERGNRCLLCYLLRLDKTAKVAIKKSSDYFTTTLSVSPYKNAKWVNQSGRIVSEKYGVKFLFADFKKNDGYKKSIEYSQEYGLYRQSYCGCEFSYNAKLACLPNANNTNNNAK